MEDRIIKEINKINKNILKCNISLKNFNTMKLDGKCKNFIMPTNIIELKKVLIILKKNNVKYHVIGNGSNIIFTSKEKECIIKLNFNKSKHFNIIHASDLLMIKANEFANLGYKGLEYISNIPASIGGAILMNAGAYNHFFSDIIEFVYYIDEDLKIKVASRAECGFSYRNSVFKGSNKIILGCKVKLIEEDKEELKRIMNECKEKRKNTQPIEFANSGSIFKNKDDISAWKLIEYVHLKGKRKNNAVISEKHCNFIVNEGDAKNEDVIYLINLVKDRVKNVLGVNIEEEVIIMD